MTGARRTILCGLPVLCCALSLGAATLPLRDAKALAAEYTTARVRVEGLTPESFPAKLPPVAAQVVLTVEDKRKLSRHDYQLRIGERDYPIAGLRRGDGSQFSFKLWKLADLRQGEKIAMLFFIDSDAAETPGPWKLRWVLPQEELVFPLTFENLGGSELSAPSSIPDEGKLSRK